MFQGAYNPNDRDLPPIAVPAQKSRFGARKIPQYVRQGFPAVLQSQAASHGDTLPRIHGGYQMQQQLAAASASPMQPPMYSEDANYGLIYNKPETEAEKTMNELWIARRRQEVAITQ